MVDSIKMELREPKKKRKGRLQYQAPFPIPNGSAGWTLYTAHLTDLGSCIADPAEIIAVHSMGYFGKGYLSRGYPSFGKARYGAPPVVRNRQWIRRQQWMKDVKDLDNEPFSCMENSANEGKSDFVKTDSHVNVVETPQKDVDIVGKETEGEKENKSNETNLNDASDGDNNKIMPENVDSHSQMEIIDISMETRCSNVYDAREESVDEVVLDSAEEDDTCVVVNKEETTNNEIRKLLALDTHNFESKDTYVNRSKNLQGKLLVLPDSDSEGEDYLKDIKPRVEDEGFPLRETLHLTFEETFFLLFGLGCLQLINFDGSLLDINSAWLHFCKEDKDFLQKYVVYHYFRSKGWVVKPGVKYGGDFLLYKQGPPFYHASYIVIIDVVNADSLTRETSRSMHKITWSNLFGLDRLSETAAKEILFAQVLWPSSVPQSTALDHPDILSEFTVKELLWRRWNPKQNRTQFLEEEDEDSG